MFRHDPYDAGDKMKSEAVRGGAWVAIQGLTKSYGNVTAVDNVSIDVEGGEFLALLGPSGSGKSTVLMAIAGFEIPTAGKILLDGREITTLPPHRRGIGMVFQRYALFPHLTVAENIAYPLRRRSFSRTEIEFEVERALRLVNLEALGARYPNQLSGGQQQRVAVARALVFRPPLLLMDEPLGALDRKLRQQMQMELKLLHKDLGTTIVMVTHDQEEALSMADRVAVLNRGKIEQIGDPDSLYREPQSAFVADFIGETNLLPVDIVARTADTVVAKLNGIDTPIRLPASHCLAPGKQALLGIRHEHVGLVQAGGMKSVVIEQAFAGSTKSVLLDLSGTRVTARVPSGLPLGGPGSERMVCFPGEACRLYPVV